MSAFPLLPRYAKMIILGQQFDNTPYIIAIVAGLSVGDPFLSFEELPIVEDPAARSNRQRFDATRREFSRLDEGCDVLRLLSAIGAYEYAGATDEFCEGKFLRIKTMKEIRKLRIQITNLVNNLLAGIVSPVRFKANLAPPSAVQIRTIKQIVAAAYLDHIAIRSDLLDVSPSKGPAKDILRAEYCPLIPVSRSSSLSDMGTAFVYPNSALARSIKVPEYVVYSDLRESQSERLRLIPLTPISAREIEPLAKGTPLIQYSKPLNYPPPRIFTEHGLMKKEVYVVPRFGIRGRSWELPSVKRVEDLVKH